MATHPIVPTAAIAHKYIALIDQRRARIETIRHVLLSIDYDWRDLDAIVTHDPLIIGSGPEFFHPQVEQHQG